MEKLAEKLNIQLKAEQDAFKLYNQFVAKIDNTKIKNRIKEIIADELTHIKLMEESIELIKNLKPKISKEKIKKSKIDLSGFIKDFSNILVITDIANYPKTIVEILNQVRKNCLYISFNKLPQYTKSVLKENGIDTKKITFITCVKTDKKEDISIDPDSLTDLSIAINSMAEKDKIFVIVDTISSFLIHHKTETILKFVSSINSSLHGLDSGIVWLAITDETGSEFNTKLSQLCDKVIKV